MNKNIAIVTDSTADIDPRLAAEKEISVVPLNVHFGEEVYKDGIDLNQAEFFRKLEAAPMPPRTSQPSPGEFHELYQNLLNSGYQGIISIHISRELSGTWQSATIARGMLTGANIAVVDSKSASMGLGLNVLSTWEKLQAGASLEEAAEYARGLYQQQKIFFGVATLEYLHRNGRIGRATKVIGGLLNVKPILTIDGDGFVAPLEKVRGMNKFVPYLLEGAREFVAGHSGPVDIAIVHAQDPQYAEDILQLTKERIGIRNSYLAEIGSVIGTHTGPGTIGMVVQKS
ncbi:MAG TPA: DegV family protein [Bacillota bacterium]|nr:DegV family protein [Bacillota bacterium]HPZ21685.1 DegV family protein [Bacillota bacterium]HQD19522.1 DegV family protein [Bacillota bacterium]